MNIDDMILVSIDDHVVEPPDMFAHHVPAKYADQAPHVVTDERGVDQWIYQGKVTGVSGSKAAWASLSTTSTIRWTSTRSMVV